MSRKKAFFAIILIALLVILIIVFGGVVKESFDVLQGAPDQLKELSKKYPVIGPLTIIGVIVIEVVIAPLPGGFLPVLTGVLFGTLIGTLYSWIGNVLGAILAFLIARRFGRKLVERLVEKKKLLLYEKFVEKYQKLIWFTYVVPFFPIDIISFSMGLSKISLKRFSFFSGVALLPDMWLLNALGNSIHDSNISYILWIIAILLVSILVHAFLKELKNSETK